MSRAVLWRPAFYHWMSALLLGVLGAVIVGVGLLDYSEKITVDGAVQTLTRPVTLVATTQGVVDQLRVSEGDFVQAGAPLVQLNLHRYLPDGQREADLRAKEILRKQTSLRDELSQLRELTQMRIDALQSSHRHLLTRRQAQSEELDLYATQLDMALSNRDRARQLFSEGWLSHVDVERAQLAYIERQQTQQQGVQKSLELDQQIDASTRQIHAVRAEGELNRLRLLERLSDTDDELHRLRRRAVETLVAPVSGNIAQLNVQDGYAVSAGHILLTLTAHDNHHNVELILPSSAVARVLPGMPVNLRYAGYPYQQYGQVRGVVARVSPVTYRPDQAAYKALVKVDAVPATFANVPSGMRVSADVILERSALWRRLLDPLQATFDRV